MTAYLRKGGGRLEHPVSVFLLADSGLWTVAPSDDGNVLAHEIERSDMTLIRRNVGWQSSSRSPESKDTPSDSALKALGQIATAERKRPGRKLLLWVGPGWGMGSGTYADAGSGSQPTYANASRGSQRIFDTVWWFSGLLREAHLTWNPKPTLT